MERILAPKKVLVVDPDPAMAQALQRTCGFIADIEGRSDFLAARESLAKNPPDFLVTHLRLGAYNGLHLMYLARAGRRPTRSICYSTVIDMALIKEAQGIGAFFEAPTRVPYALISYLRSPLPEFDRRFPRETDRRREFRGGRRSADVAAFC